MIKDDTMVVVRNRDRGAVGYTLDNNFHRNFEPNESKKVPYSELAALQYAPGGAYILEHFLVVEDKTALEALNMTVEPEYFYTEADVRKILLEPNNMDEFMDFIDFAPEGAIDIAKDIAVKEQIPDVRKREALSKKTGLNINNAIMVNQVMNEGEGETEAPKERRVKKDAETATSEVASKPERRVPQYKVVTK